MNMTAGHDCKSCKKQVTLIGESQVKQPGEAILYDIDVTREDKDYKIKVFTCPYCGDVHTVQIDDNNTLKILERAKHTIKKGAFGGLEPAAKKRFRRKYIRQSNLLKTERTILSSWANDKEFQIKDSKKSIIYKYFVYGADTM